MMMLSAGDELLLEAAAASLRNAVVILHALQHALAANLDTPTGVTADLRFARRVNDQAGRRDRRRDSRCPVGGGR